MAFCISERLLDFFGEYGSFFLNTECAARELCEPKVIKALRNPKCVQRGNCPFPAQLAKLDSLLSLLRMQPWLGHQMSERNQLKDVVLNAIEDYSQNSSWNTFVRIVGDSGNLKEMPGELCVDLCIDRIISEDQKNPRFNTLLEQMDAKLLPNRWLFTRTILLVLSKQPPFAASIRQCDGTDDLKLKVVQPINRTELIAYLDAQWEAFAESVSSLFVEKTRQDCEDNGRLSHGRNAQILSHREMVDLCIIKLKQFNPRFGKISNVLLETSVFLVFCEEQDLGEGVAIVGQEDLRMCCMKSGRYFGVAKEVTYGKLMLFLDTHLEKFAQKVAALRSQEMKDDGEAASS